MKAKEIVYNIPGGFYGNNPSPEYKEATVIIDFEKVCQAIKWLKRRRYHILETGLSPYKDGLRIVFTELT